MGQWMKLVTSIRASQANVRFKDLTGLVKHIGFEHKRTKGSHEIYQHPKVSERLNLQDAGGGKAKPYQVRQVLQILDEEGLEVKD